MKAGAPAGQGQSMDRNGLIFTAFSAARAGCIRRAGGIRVYRFPDCRSRFVALEVHCD
jgi:hypothetical protein